MPLIIEGTCEEIKERASEFIGRRVVLIVKPEVDEAVAALPPPPFTIRNRQHLEELLLESLDGPLYEVTEETWVALRRRINEYDSAPKPAES